MKKVLRIILIVLLVIGLLLAIVPLLIPVPALPDISTAAKLADADSKFMQLDQIQVHYKEAGQGNQNMVLLHGFGASVYSWREVLAPLASLGHVLAYDRPAFGLTERPVAWDGPNPYSMEANARLLLDLMDARGMAQAVLVGNSAGGTLAVYTALHYPQRVQALILVDPAIYGGGTTIPEWLKPVLHTPQATRLGQLFVRQISDWGMTTLIQAWYDPQKVTPEIKAAYRKPLQMPDWDRALWELTLANSPLDLGAHLNELKMPVLVVAGDTDRIIPTAQSVQVSSAVPGSSLVIFNQCGHVPQEECPDQFMQAVTVFLKEKVWLP